MLGDVNSARTQSSLGTCLTKAAMQALNWTHSFTDRLPGDKETTNSLRQVVFCIAEIYPVATLAATQ